MLKKCCDLAHTHTAKCSNIALCRCVYISHW